MRERTVEESQGNMRRNTEMMIGDDAGDGR